MGIVRALIARSSAGASFPDLIAARARRAADVPPLLERYRLYRRVGPLRRVPRLRDGYLQGSGPALRRARCRTVARDPPRDRQRHSLQGLDAPADARLHVRELPR